MLAVYFNKDGTTTINPNVGKEKELGTKIASFVKENILVSDVKQAAFSIKGINGESFALLTEYLKEECNITETLVSDVNGHRFIFKSPFKDTMTVTRYANGNTLFQGKPLYVFSEIKVFLTDILEFKDIINIENEIYKVNISINDIKTELEQNLINSRAYLASPTKKMLSSALTLKKIDVNMEDYSSIAFPALRAMEGYLKQSFSEKGINIGADGFI